MCDNWTNHYEQTGDSSDLYPYENNDHDYREKLKRNGYAATLSELKSREQWRRHPTRLHPLFGQKKNGRKTASRLNFPETTLSSERPFDSRIIDTRETSQVLLERLPHRYPQI